jgi:hypothetical protein
MQRRVREQTILEIDQRRARLLQRGLAAAPPRRDGDQLQAIEQPVVQLVQQHELVLAPGTRCRWHASLHTIGLAAPWLRRRRKLQNC